MILDVRGRYIFGAKLAGPETPTPGRHERRISNTRRRMATRNMAARLFFQKCEKSHVSRNEHTQSLPMVISR